MEPEETIGNPGGFAIKNKDVFYAILGVGPEAPRVAFEIVEIETLVNMPPHVPRYVTNLCSPALTTQADSAQLPQSHQVSSLGHIRYPLRELVAIIPPTPGGIVSRALREETTLLVTLSFSPSIDELQHRLSGMIDWHPFDPQFRRDAPRTGLTPRTIHRDDTALRMVFSAEEEPQVEYWLQVLRSSAHGTPAYWEARRLRYNFNELDWWPLRVRKTFTASNDCPGQWALEITLGVHGYEVVEVGFA